MIALVFIAKRCLQYVRDSTFYLEMCTFNDDLATKSTQTDTVYQFSCFVT